MGSRNKRPMLIAIGGLLAMAAGVGVGRFVYTPILPPMVEALSLSKSQAGLIASANFVGYLAGALLAAMRLAGSRRAWLLGALAVNTVCLAAMGLTTSMPVFLALRLVAGIVSAFAVSWIMKLTRKDRSEYPLMMELPSYRLPNARNLAVGLVERAEDLASDFARDHEHADGQQVDVVESPDDLLQFDGFDEFAVLREFADGDHTSGGFG